jgi:hypothetical protein
VVEEEEEEEKKNEHMAQGYVFVMIDRRGYCCIFEYPSIFVFHFLLS